MLSSSGQAVFMRFDVKSSPAVSAQVIVQTNHGIHQLSVIWWFQVMWNGKNKTVW